MKQFVKIGFEILILKCPFFCIFLPFTTTVWLLKALLRFLEVSEPPFTQSVVFFFPLQGCSQQQLHLFIQLVWNVRQSVVLSTGLQTLDLGLDQYHWGESRVAKYVRDDFLQKVSPRFSTVHQHLVAYLLTDSCLSQWQKCCFVNKIMTYGLTSLGLLPNSQEQKDLGSVDMCGYMWQEPRIWGQGLCV